MEYLKFITKHTDLYLKDQEYTSTIDQFLYDNFRDYIMSYESELEMNDNSDIEMNDNSESIEEVRNTKIEIDIDEINEQHKNEIQNLTNNYENIIAHYKESHENELKKIKNETTELVKKEFELKYTNNLISIQTEHKTEILNLTNKYNKEISGLQKEISDLKSSSSIKLGCKAEQELKDLFISMGKNCIDKHKTNHVADLWIVDDANKILYVIESKNKGKILSGDLVKFKNDLDNIKANIQPNEYENYEIIGLFVSTRGDSINSEIGSFSFSYYETYISQQFITKEFFKLYFKSIETLTKLKTDNSNYNETLNLITIEYNSLRSLIELCDNINNNAKKIINTSNDIKQEISIKMSKFENKLIEINSPHSIQLEIENKIKEYIRNNENFKFKVVREMANGYNIFNGKKMNKQDLIEWANKPVN